MKAIGPGKATQIQNEALIDLVTIFCQIDGKIRLAESDFVSDWLSELHWNSGTALETYQSNAVARCRKSISNDEEVSWLQSIVDRLTGGASKDSVVELAVGVAESDKELAKSERSLINTLLRLLHS